MNYISVKYLADKWDISERSVRNYCAENKIDGAYLKGKTQLFYDADFLWYCDFKIIRIAVKGRIYILMPTINGLQKTSRFIRQLADG